MEKEALKIKSLELINGTKLLNCLIDPLAETPPDFIAVKLEEQPEQGSLIQFIKVANIASFSIEEKDRAKLWDYFRPLPETVITKNY